MTASAASTRGVTLAALLAALARPTWWLLALAGFLIRGGTVLFLLAVVTVPSPLALSNVLQPYVQPFFLGGFEPRIVTVIAVGLVSLLAWLFAGSWFAAATEVVLVRDAHAVAADEGLPVGPSVDPGGLVITRAAVAHIVCLVPAAAIAGLASISVVAVTYRELVNPSDAGPIVVRVLIGAAGPIAAVLVAWILGEIVGGLAVRRIVLLGEPVVGAIGRAVGGVAGHPLRNLVAPLLTLVVLVLDLAAVLLVVSIVWTDVHDRLADPTSDPVGLGLALLTFAGAWCLALIVTGLVAAWRSVAASLETDRAAASTRTAAVPTTPESPALA